ncbi:MAG: hypothetical protein EXS35_11765 [Pedosphaera sp.]|nr:hypothetical protein [Pedosphaera sp.]
MKRNRRNAVQIFEAWRKANELIARGHSVAEVCGVMQIGEATFYRWQKGFAVVNRIQRARAKRKVEQHLSPDERDRFVILGHSSGNIVIPDKYELERLAALKSENSRLRREVAAQRRSVVRAAGAPNPETELPPPVSNG